MFYTQEYKQILSLKLNKNIIILHCKCEVIILKFWFVRLGEIICSMVEALLDYIKEFWEDASVKCKWYTASALILLFIFCGIDVYEYHLNCQAEKVVEDTADTVFDSITRQIDLLDTQTQEIMKPIKEMAIEIKPQWIKIALLAASSIIGVFIDAMKKPVEGIKDILSEGIEDEKDEPKMWIPFWLLVVIDITEICLTFS